jgi:hypothetical protein
MAPEQASGRALGPHVDWYSVGVMLFEAMTGMLPFSGPTLEVLLRKQTERAPVASSLVSGLPADLDALCGKLLEANLGARLSGADVLACLGVSEATVEERLPSGERAAARDMPTMSEGHRPGPRGVAANTGPTPLLAGGVRPAQADAAGLLESTPSPLVSAVSLSGSSLAALERALFVGRARELAVLEEAFQQSAKETRSVLISGESGLGKSSLVRRFIDRHLERDARLVVLSGRCYERESVPYKAFDGVVDALSRYLLRQEEVVAARLLPRERDAAALMRVFPVLSRVPAMAEMRGDKRRRPDAEVIATELRARAFAALRELLVRISDRGPTVLCIDDLQWADIDSLVLLEHLLHPPGAPRVLFLATLRSGKPRLPGEVTHLVLEPLSREEASRLARSVTAAASGGLARLASGVGGSASAEGDQAVWASIADDAKGHPLFVVELARQAETSGRTLRLDDALWQRVEALPERTRRVLEVVCLAGEPLAQGTAGETVGLEWGECARQVAVLRQAHLCRTLGTRAEDVMEPYHDRVRESVVAHLEAGVKRLHHVQLALALERAGVAGSAPHRLVRHLEAAGELGRAAQMAEVAADQARQALAFQQAAELYRDALRLGDAAPASDDGATRVRHLRQCLAEALANAGHGQEAAHTFLAAAEGGDDATRLTCQSEAARLLLGSGHVEEGLQVLQRVLREFGGRWPKTPAAAILRLLYHRAMVRLRGLSFRPRTAEQLPARALLCLETYDSVATAMGIIDHIRAAPCQAYALRMALALGEPLRIGRALAKEACFTASAGRSASRRAQHLVERVRGLSELVPDQRAELEGWVALGQSITLFLTGRFQEALPALGDAERRLRDEVRGKFAELTAVRIFRMLAAVHVGAFVDMSRSVNEYIRDAARRGDRHTETSMTRGFSFVWLSRDDPDEVQRRLAACTWSAPEHGFHQQHWYELLAHTYLGLYRGQADVQHYEAGLEVTRKSFLLQTQVVRCWSRYLRAIVWLHASRLGQVTAAEGQAAAMRSVRQLSGEKVPYARHWATVLRAVVAARQGRIDEARRGLREVSTAARGDGLHLVAMCARRRLGELTGGEEGHGLIEAADAFMNREGIKSPERMSALWVPSVAAS